MIPVTEENKTMGKTVKVTAPNREFSGPGPGGTHFVDGVAEVPADAHGALQYFRGAGYGVDGDEPQPDPLEQPVPDARTVAETQQLGTRLRDAAVNPRPADFLPPTNAGQANPHGPLVVSPGIHGSPTGPIVPGPVGAVTTSGEVVSDPARQQEVETAVAEAVFVQQGDVGRITQAAAEANPQPNTTDDRATAETVERPAKSANKDEWVAYAKSVAQDSDEAAEVDKLTKDQLIERYGA